MQIAATRTAFQGIGNYLEYRNSGRINFAKCGSRNLSVQLWVTSKITAGSCRPTAGAALDTIGQATVQSCTLTIHGLTLRGRRRHRAAPSAAGFSRGWSGRLKLEAIPPLLSRPRPSTRAPASPPKFFPIHEPGTLKYLNLPILLLPDRHILQCQKLAPVLSPNLEATLLNACPDRQFFQPENLDDLRDASICISK